jgi:hypothetical protein
MSQRSIEVKVGALIIISLALLGGSPDPANGFGDVPLLLKNIGSFEGRGHILGIGFGGLRDNRHRVWHHLDVLSESQGRRIHKRTIRSFHRRNRSNNRS